MGRSNKHKRRKTKKESANRNTHTKREPHCEQKKVERDPEFLSQRAMDIYEFYTSQTDPVDKFLISALSAFFIDENIVKIQERFDAIKNTNIVLKKRNLNGLDINILNISVLMIGALLNYKVFGKKKENLALTYAYKYLRSRVDNYKGTVPEFSDFFSQIHLNMTFLHMLSNSNHKVEFWRISTFLINDFQRLPFPYSVENVVDPLSVVFNPKITFFEYNTIDDPNSFDFLNDWCIYFPTDDIRKPVPEEKIKYWHVADLNNKLEFVDGGVCLNSALFCDEFPAYFAKGQVPMSLIPNYYRYPIHKVIVRGMEDYIDFDYIMFYTCVEFVIEELYNCNRENLLFFLRNDNSVVQRWDNDSKRIFEYIYVRWCELNNMRVFPLYNVYLCSIPDEVYFASAYNCLRLDCSSDWKKDLIPFETVFTSAVRSKFSSYFTVRSELKNKYYDRNMKFPKIKAVMRKMDEDLQMYSQRNGRESFLLCGRNVRLNQNLMKLLNIDSREDLTPENCLKAFNEYFPQPDSCLEQLNQYPKTLEGVEVINVMESLSVDKSKVEDKFIGESKVVKTGKTVIRNGKQLPKKVRRAYTFYLEEKRPVLSAQNPEMEGSDISDMINEEWFKLDEDQKRRYHELAAQDKVRYEEELLQYEADPENTFNDDDPQDTQKEVCPESKAEEVMAIEVEEAKISVKSDEKVYDEHALTDKVNRGVETERKISMTKQQQTEEIDEGESIISTFSTSTVISSVRNTLEKLPVLSEKLKPNRNMFVSDVEYQRNRVSYCFDLHKRAAKAGIRDRYYEENLLNSASDLHTASKLLALYMFGPYFILDSLLDRDNLREALNSHRLFNLSEHIDAISVQEFLTFDINTFYGIYIPEKVIELLNSVTKTYYSMFDVEITPFRMPFCNKDFLKSCMWPEFACSHSILMSRFLYLKTISFDKLINHYSRPLDPLLRFMITGVKAKSTVKRLHNVSFVMQHKIDLIKWVKTHEQRN
ncbi:hypothetical protein PCE1_001400 [Barthelona sp. PCE]